VGKGDVEKGRKDGKWGKKGKYAMGIILPFDDENYNTAVSSSSTAVPSWDDLKRLGAEMKKALQRDLRRSAEMVEEMTCSVCRRKPTVCRDGGGEVIHVCPHTWEALQRLPKAAVDDRLPASLTGLRIQVFDDGPSRW
jgi:hypothetical protein